MRQKARLGLAATVALLLHLGVLLIPGLSRKNTPSPSLSVEIALPPPAGLADRPPSMAQPALAPAATPPSPARPFSPSPLNDQPAAPVTPAAGGRQENGVANGEPAGRPAVPAAAKPAAGSSRPPQCRRDPRPELPAISRSLGEEGSARLRLLIGADGVVRSVTVVESSGFSRLDEAARRTLRQWRCQPALRHGEPVSAELDETVVFELK